MKTRKTIHSMVIAITLFLLGAWPTLALSERTKNTVWPKGPAGELLSKICSTKPECRSVHPKLISKFHVQENLISSLLRLPTLTDGYTAAERRRLQKLSGKPALQLEYALNKAVKLLGQQPRARRWSESKRMDVIQDMLVIEYNQGQWSTLPDDLMKYQQALHDIGTSSEHVNVAFNVSVNDSWPNGPTFLLDAAVYTQNGPVTHFRLYCDQCEDISTGSDWQEWEQWNPVIAVTGEGYKNICIEVRAEPYQNNWANTAIACDAIGTPSVATTDSDEAQPAASNNPVQRCFGAIGNNCGPADEEGFDVGLCVRPNPLTEPDKATCMINVGSWTHDQCCIEKRVGGNAPLSEQGSCSPHMAVLLNQPYACEAEFNKAVAHIFQGYTWVRNVDASIENTSGVVEFDQYCATAGSIVHQNDVANYCCSRQGEPNYNNPLDFTGRVCL